MREKSGWFCAIGYNPSKNETLSPHHDEIRELLKLLQKQQGRYTQQQVPKDFLKFFIADAVGKNAEIDLLNVCYKCMFLKGKIVA
jgi:hypothetical protein